MKCYILKEGQKLNMDNLKKEEVSPKIEKIINYVVEKHIKLREFTITLNGTIYSEKLLVIF